MGYFVYLLQCCDGSLYTGITNDIKKRVEEHIKGRGSKYVRSRLPFELVYQEELSSKSLALKRESAIKKMTREEKKELVKAG